MLQGIREMIKEVCKEEGWEFRESDQAYSYPIYPDHGDCKLDKDEGERILCSKDPREELEQIVFSHWDDCAGNMIGEIIDIVQERIEKREERKDNALLYDQIYEESNEIMFPEYPVADYLGEMYEVNLVLDTGDQNTDYGENNFAPHYSSSGEDLNISKESSLLWLVKQQGRTKRDLVRVIKKAGKTDDLFLKSVYQEVENSSSCMNTVTFLVKMSLEYILKINEAIAKRDEKGFQYEPSKRPHAGEIRIPKSCMCGLVDYWYGAGSVLEIQLEKDVVLPIRYLRSADPDEWERYSITEIYGMCKSAWKTEVSLHMEEK